MKTRIYVGNLAYTATAIDIRLMFEPFGEVAAAHVYTAGKKRFAFVQMTNEADGDSAIEGLIAGEFFGRELVIQWANKQRPVRGSRAGDARGLTAKMSGTPTFSERN